MAYKMTNSNQNVSNSNVQTDQHFLVDEVSSTSFVLCKNKSIDSSETVKENINYEKDDLIKTFLEAFERYYVKNEYLNDNDDEAVIIKPADNNFTTSSPSVISSTTILEERNKHNIRKTKLLENTDSHEFKTYLPNFYNKIREAYKNCSCKVCECITANSFEKDDNNDCDCYSCQNKLNRFLNLDLARANVERNEKEIMYIDDFLSTTNCKCNPCDCETCALKYSYNNKDASTLNCVQSQNVTVSTVSKQIKDNFNCSECVGHYDSLPFEQLEKQSNANPMSSCSIAIFPENICNDNKSSVFIPENVKCIDGCRKSPYETLLNIFGKVTKTKKSCDCVSCECVKCKDKNKHIAHDDRNYVILERQMNQKSKTDFTKPNTETEEPCECEKCDCVYCQSANRYCTHMYNVSCESVYPIKKGRLLTPSKFDIYDKSAVQVQSDKHKNATDEFISCRYLPKFQEKCNANNVWSRKVLLGNENNLSKFVGHKIGLNNEITSNDPILEIKDTKIDNNTKNKDNKFGCLMQCSNCYYQTILTLNDVTVLHDKKENSSTIAVQSFYLKDVAVQCDILFDVMSHTDLLKRSRLLTLRINEYIIKLSNTNLDTNNEDLSDQIPRYNLNNYNRKYKDYKELISRIFIRNKNCDEQVRNSTIRANLMKINSDNNRITIESLPLERWKIHTKLDKDESGIPDRKSNYEFANNNHLKDGKAKVIHNFHNITNIIPKGLFNQENYEKYKELIKEVVQIIGKIQEMKSELNIKSLRNLTEAEHN